jgi:hypothetical protein
MHRQCIEGLATVGQVSDQGVDARVLELHEIHVENLMTLVEQVRDNMTTGFATAAGKNYAFGHCILNYGCAGKGCHTVLEHALQASSTVINRL